MENRDLLTVEEENVVRILAADTGNRDRLWFYIVVLVAPLGMAVYGFLQRDYLALAVAFFGLFILVAWWVWREIQHLAIFRSIAKKMLSANLLTKCGNDV